MWETKKTTRPVAGEQVRQTLDLIEESWREMEDGELTAESARNMQRDLFELVGMVKGLMMGAELLRDAAPTSEPKPRQEDAA